MVPVIRRLGSALLIVLMALAPRCGLADSLHILAAGSLTSAFSNMVKAFGAPGGDVAAPVFGPSGLLRSRIEHGEPADMFASGDMEQPRILARERSGLPVVMFTRNRLCALGRASLGLTTDNMVDRLLDPKVRLATSTPGADPAGDYAWAVFARSEAIHPGARAILQAKAMKLVGGPNTPPLIPGRGAVEGIFMSDRADVMLGYCSSSAPVMHSVSGLTSVPLPAPTSAVVHAGARG